LPSFQAARASALRGAITGEASRRTSQAEAIRAAASNAQENLIELRAGLGGGSIEAGGWPISNVNAANSRTSKMGT